MSYYELKFENLFLRSKANEFQLLFSTLMGYAHKEDFMACRPWGKVGDRKNDGFLRSEKRLFQVYAPDEMTAKKAVSKIEEDFNGGKEYWGAYFEKWSFVHNAQALPPHIHKCILDFEAKNSAIRLDTWGFSELTTRLRLISYDDLVSWLGLPITQKVQTYVGYKELEIVLNHISTHHAIDHTYPVQDVPVGKLESNMLSPAIVDHLKLGFVKSYMVGELFNKWHDPSYGERLATAFREKYKDLKATSRVPSKIFYELQTWAGGEIRQAPEHELAVIIVLAYFFSTCDIFEPHRQN